MPATPRLFAIGPVTAVVQFGLAILAFGGWTAFFSHPALIALAVVTLAMMAVAPFSSGNLSSGQKEDRANRWVFAAFSLIALLSAIVPPCTDRIGLWTIDGEVARWTGVALCTAGGALRLWPVFVLGSASAGWSPFSRATSWRHADFMA